MNRKEIIEQQKQLIEQQKKLIEQQQELIRQQQHEKIVFSPPIVIPYQEWPIFPNPAPYTVIYSSDHVTLPAETKIYCNPLPDDVDCVYVYTSNELMC